MAVHPVAVGFFFGSMSILEGKGIAEAQNRISAVSVIVVPCSTCTRCSGCVPRRLMCRHCFVIGAVSTCLFFFAQYSPRSRGVFIPAQIINFALVPHHLRFVFVGVVSLFWSKLYLWLLDCTREQRHYRHIPQCCQRAATETLTSSRKLTCRKGTRLTRISRKHALEQYPKKSVGSGNHRSSADSLQIVVPA